MCFVRLFFCVGSGLWRLGVVIGRGYEFPEEGDGGGIGDVWKSFAVTLHRLGGGFPVAEYLVGYGKKCLKFGVEFGPGYVGDGKSPCEDVEGSRLGRCQGLVGTVDFEGRA